MKMNFEGVAYLHGGQPAARKDDLPGELGPIRAVKAECAVPILPSV